MRGVFHRRRNRSGRWVGPSVAALVAALIGFASTASAGKPQGERWILIDTTRHTLSVLRGDRLLARFSNVAFGRGGFATDRSRGDGTTPLGTFRIDRINSMSRFHFFFGIDFPRPEHAQRAFDSGRIDAQDYQRIVAAFEERRPPPQDTPLGGQLGIHGLGRGDRQIHDALNWTQGCIALTNDQIRRLSRFIQVGMRVEVR